MASPAQTKATAKYIKEHVRRYVVLCNQKSEGDLIAFLDAQENKNAFLKALIRAEMERQQENL